MNSDHYVGNLRVPTFVWMHCERLSKIRSRNWKPTVGGPIDGGLCALLDGYTIRMQQLEREHDERREQRKRDRSG